MEYGEDGGRSWVSFVIVLEDFSLLMGYRHLIHSDFNTKSYIYSIERGYEGHPIVKSGRISVASLIPSCSSFTDV